MREAEHVLEDRQRATTGVSLDDAITVERRSADPEERTDHVHGDRRHGDHDAVCAQRARDPSDVLPGLGRRDVRLIEQVGAVASDLGRGVDRDRPPPPIPHVTVAAQPDAAGRVLDVVVERHQRPPRHRLPDRRMVEHDQVVPLELLDRLIGERLQGPRLPRDLDVGPLRQIGLGRRPKAAVSAHVIPRDAEELDHHAEPAGNGAPSTPTSNRVRCQRPRLEVNIVVPRKARLVGCASV